MGVVSHFWVEYSENCKDYYLEMEKYLKKMLTHYHIARISISAEKI